MSKFNLSWKVNDLKNECKRLKISYSGKKNELVNRLNEYMKKNSSEVVEEVQKSLAEEESVELVDVEIAVPAINNNEFNEMEEQDDKNEEDILNENGKRVRCVYIKEEEFDNIHIAKQKLENNWKYLRLRPTRNGMKEYFICNLGANCKKQIFILYHDDDQKVSIWHSSLEHDHTNEKKQFGINSVTKKTIDTLYMSKVNTATLILHSLRERKDQFKPKKFETDPDVPNEQHVPGIVIPTILQIYNYLNNTLKPIIYAKSHKNRFSYGDLENWVQNNCLVINTSIIRLTLSSKALLKLAMKTSHICADATYKLMWHNFPVFIIGTTDLNRSFHPFSVSICTNETGQDYEFVFSSVKKALNNIYNFEYKPSALIADGAEAITNSFISAFGYQNINEFLRIMCWAHVHRAVDSHTKLIDELNKPKIRDDINLLQISPNREYFNFAYELFKKKWSNKSSVIDSFLKYFESTWSYFRNSGWYEGIAENIPSTDNALESRNGKIKLIHTLRKRLSVNVYLTNAVNMLRHWSLDTFSEKPFISTEISEGSWKLASIYLY
ncbi:unnamed protein product, partial [Brachionus calyciflorus]